MGVGIEGEVRQGCRSSVLAAPRMQAMAFIVGRANRMTKPFFGALQLKATGTPSMSEEDLTVLLPELA